MIDPALVERFETPPSEYGPTPLWWWSGGTVTEEGIDWQLRRFADGGIRNLVLMNLAPKGPTYGAPPDDPVWFGERWWELFRYTCDRARDLGIALWFYDQIGFSGANLQGVITARHPEAAGRSLRSHVVEVPADGVLPEEPREHLIAVFDVEPDADGRWARHEARDGRVDLPAGSRLRVVAWHETSFDYLDEGSVARLIDFVHGEYERRVPEHVGTTIVGSFQDELPAMPTWSATFAERFRDETGYDLVACLPALWDHGSPASAGVRADYHRVRTLLAERAFFKPLGEWHRARGMLIGADQMNPARAGVPTQSTQLYGDYYATHRWFDAVGSDHEGDARIHSSMADMYDHPRVWIESFHSSGWGGTLEDTWDWLIPFFRSGANLYNPHASYYGLRAGWFEWAPPSTDFRQPYYAVYPEFARAVARVSALMTWGRHAVDVAVLYPSTSISSELPPDLPIDHFLDGDIGEEYPGVDVTQRTYMALAGKNDWFRAQPGLLDRSGIDFDVVDEDSFARSVAGDRTLDVNGFRFGTVILPSTTRLPDVVVDRLAALLRAGGRVLGVGDVDERLVGIERFPTPEAAVAAVDRSALFARSAHGVRAQEHGDHGVALLPGAFPNATAFPLRTDEGAGGWDDIDFDATRYGQHDELRVRGSVVEAEVWDPATGRRTPTSFEVAADGASSTIAVASGGSPLLIAVWRTGATVDEPQLDAPAEPSVRSLETAWSQELVPTLDNRWGDFALPASTEPIPLELWSVDQVTAEGSTPVTVTMGQELLVSGPFPDTEAPEPLDPDSAARARDGGPLAGPGWAVQRFSASLGRDGALGAAQDPKGFIAEEFVTHETPAVGEEVAVRALVRVPGPGDLELTISSACATRAWFDGVELELTGSGFDATASVRFASTVGVLEYRMGTPALPGGSTHPATHVTSAFRLERPGERSVRPEFVGAGERGVVDGSATFRRAFRIDADASDVRVVTGAPSALTVFLDGQAVARQEKVEYYESGLGDLPNYFLHELGTLVAGDHVIEVTTDGVTPTTPLFVDLVLVTRSGTVAVPSGADWSVGPDDDPVVLLPARTGSTVHARAAVRPHPLPAAHWLSGPPEVGSPAVPFETAVSSVPRAETFALRLPAGAAAVELPVDPQHVDIPGRDIVVSGRTVSLDVPTDAPATLEVTVAPRAFSTSGAAWPEPVRVRTVPTPARFEDWSEQHLESWSGAVRYSTPIEASARGAIRIDLGTVRGAVEVELDGERVAAAFCAPWSFTIPGVDSGRHELAVTVYGTLAPRYAAATQTTFLKPAQLRTGITGEVRVELLTDQEDLR